MWSRRELKERGKRNFKRFYWKAVLVSFICVLLTGGLDTKITKKIGNNYNSSIDSTYDSQYYVNDEFFSQEELQDKVLNAAESFVNSGIFLTAVSFSIVIMIIGFIIKLLITYPIEIGKNNFFVGIREKEKTLDSLIFIYKSGQLKNTIITMFMKGVFQFLWGLLFVIPGIIKSYEYRMIPYILSENPQISRQRAFELSKHMMRGNKWRTFVLDLSFIGWYFLSALTVGILAIFYVTPYVNGTNAELYACLREDALRQGYASRNEFIGI